MFTIALVYLLAIVVSYIAKFIFNILFGFIFSILFRQLIKFSESINKFYNKIYLHLLWTGNAFVSTFVSLQVLKYFNTEISYIFIIILFLPAVFIFNSKGNTKPENAGYFNFLTPSEKYNKNPEWYALRINKAQGLSNILGTFISIYLFGNL